jgi:hypothetical protein
MIDSNVQDIEQVDHVPNESIARVGRAAEIENQDTYAAVVEDRVSKQGLVAEVGGASRSIAAPVINAPGRAFAGTPWEFYSDASERQLCVVASVSTVACFAICAMLLILVETSVLSANDWRGAIRRGPLGKTITHARHCEPVARHSFLFQPGNSLSNAAFVLTGLWMVLFGVLDHKSQAPRPPNILVHHSLLSILLGASSIFTGVCSFIYHASYSVYGAGLDVGSIFFLLSSTNAVAVARLVCLHRRLHKTRRLVCSVCASSFIMGAILFTARVTSNKNDEDDASQSSGEESGGDRVMPFRLQPVQSIMLVGMLISTIFLFTLGNVCSGGLLGCRATSSFAVVAICLLLLAISVWQIDRLQGGKCDTYETAGHAIWHVLFAMAVFSYYLCLRGESVTATPPSNAAAPAAATRIPSQLPSPMEFAVPMVEM